MSAIARRYFTTDDRICIPDAKGRPVYYQFASANPNGYVFDPVENRGAYRSINHAEFLLVEHSAGYAVDRKFFLLQTAKARLASDLVRFWEMSAREQKGVAKKLFWINHLIAFRGEGPDTAKLSVKNALQTIEERLDLAERAKVNAGLPGSTPLKAPTPQTLKKWLAANEDHGTALALRDGRHNSGNDKARFEPSVVEAIAAKAHLFCAENRRSKLGLHRDLVGEVKMLNGALPPEAEPLKIPSYKTFCKRVDEIAEVEKDAGREGKKKAESLYRADTCGMEIIRPGQWGEMDEWKIPLFKLASAAGVTSLISPELRQALADSRAWLSVIEDASSRCAMGVRITTNPDARTATSTFRMSLSDKHALADAVAAALPWDMACGWENVATDQASWYVGPEVHGVILGVGAMPVHPPAGLARFRGHIERLFGTFHTQFIERFSGRTFTDVVAKGDYESQKRRSLTVDEFCWAFVRYLLDFYHNWKHSGLDGDTPRNRFFRLADKYGVVPPPGAECLRNVFGRSDTATLDPRGVRTQNLWFRSERLHEMFLDYGPRQVQIKWDRENLGWISVSLDGKGWLSVPCARPGFDGVSLWVWKATQEELHRHYGSDAAISEDAAYRAMAEMQKLSDLAIRRAGISMLLTDEEVSLFRKKLNIAWRINGDDRPDEVADPFAGFIPTERALALPAPTTAAPRSNPANKRAVADGATTIVPTKKWKLED